VMHKEESVGGVRETEESRADGTSAEAREAGARMSTGTKTREQTGSGQCAVGTNGCAECDSSNTACARCEAEKRLEGSQCVDGIGVPLGRSLTADPKSCSNSPSCASGDNCIDIQNNGVTKEVCTKCGNTYVPIDGACQPKDAQSASCTAGTDTNQGTCTACLGSYYLYSGGCYATCPDGYYGDSNACKPCSAIAGCSTCSSATVCTKCDGGKIVKTAAGVTSCVTEEECTGTEGFFVKGADGSKTCEACTSPCVACTGQATHCTKCNSAGETPYLRDNSCVNKAGCTSGDTHYADEAAKECKLCADGGLRDCSTCEISNTQLVCKACADGDKNKFGLGKKSCVSQCPTNSQAGSDNVCTCNNGFTPNADSTACVAASSCKTPHCRTCDNKGAATEVCTACISNYYLTPTAQCIDKCEKLRGYYADGNVCKPCSPECASCTAAGADKCLSCPAGKALKYTSETNPSDGTCVDECRANTGGCDTCGAIIGGSKYCSRCGDASQAPLNGDCATNTARTQFCTQVDGGACTQCANGLQRAARWPPCVPGSEWQAALCVRQSVQGSRQACTGTEGRLLLLLPG
ncbi:Variant-specific surface protein, partial [Giardia duodenalis]